jgi:DNA-binding LacI/PurR family transcriptional regulator
MPAQMKDIAFRAGVSITTVSHVVNATRPVAKETRDRVFRIIRELNYHRNLFGRRLARGQSDSVGLIISDIENPFFPELVKNFETAALQHGLDILLCTTNYDSDRARLAVRRMIENQVQGVAVMTSQLDDTLVDELIDAGLVTVRLDAGTKRRALSNIRVDYSRGASEAIQYLHGLGHKKIGFVSGPLGRVSAMAYRQAFVDVPSQLGLSPVRVVEGNNNMDGGADRARALLSEGDPVTAIVCGNDLAALGAMRIATEMGWRVPEDISIIGADDVAFARYAIPALTTVRLPRDELGKMAFQALDRMLRTKRRSGVEYVVDTRLVIRQSTGPARTEDMAAPRLAREAVERHAGPGAMPADSPQHTSEDIGLGVEQHSSPAHRLANHRGCSGDGTTEDVSRHADGPRGPSAVKRKRSTSSGG